MTQQTTRSPVQRKAAHPRRRDIFFHVMKTGRLIGELSKDRRISIVRKILFFGMIGALLVILLFPDIFDEAFLSIAMPLLGTILGIPLDAGFDWLAFAFALIGLLRIFPAEIVAEHYQHIFRRAAA